MKSQTVNRILYATLVVLLASCSATNINTAMISNQAPIIVYKTVADYDNNVPVLLNEARDRIVSYPAPADLYHNGELALPVRLNKGYLLDRRGINASTAYTSYTYEEYSKLEAPPSLEDLTDHIIEKDPFEAMYHCGNKSNYKDLVKELKQKISNGMPGCKALID